MEFRHRRLGERMASRGNGLRGIAVVVGVGLVLAGCEKSTDGVPASSGQSSAASTSAKPSGTDAAIWDPCTQLPDDALRAGELSPETRTKDAAGVDPTGWQVCGWRSSARWYTLTVLSGEPSLQQVQGRRDFENFTPLTVGGRPALRLSFVGDDKGLDCGVAVEVPQGKIQGTVAFLVTTRYSVGKLGDPCEQATRHASEFAKYLPSGGN
ncbi:DUF3558 domain-containing protein [Nocardia sp. NPDC052316]|uniref:DUF3558 domain-containing protein n=1 Tax=Nocardia sp. NPDC052316 TaxID=3364329 RepID=UPI0037C82236